MATSALRVIVPTIIVLILIIIGFNIYRAQQKPEDPESRQRLRAYGVVDGSEVPTTTPGKDLSDVHARIEDLKKRIGEYSDLIDPDEFIQMLESECSIPPSADGTCDANLFTTDAKGCCVPITPDKADNPTYSDIADDEKVDAERNLLCLGSAAEKDEETGAFTCPGINERYDYEQECCVRSCFVYPVDGVCENTAFPNLENECCEANDTSKEQAAAAQREAKREMMIAMGAMVLGDILITGVLPKLAETLIAWDKSRAAQAAQAGSDAANKVPNDARGQQSTVDKAKADAEAKVKNKNTKNIRAVDKYMKGAKSAKSATRKGAMRTAMSKSIGKASAKIAAKMSAKLALKLAKMIAKLGSGGLALGMLAFDIVSVLTDLGDGQNLGTYIDNEIILQGRNRIVFALDKIFTEYGVKYPMMYPIDKAFFEECKIAELAMTNYAIRDIISGWLNAGINNLDEDGVKALDIFCKFIMIGIAEFDPEVNETGNEVNLYVLTEDEQATIDYYAYTQMNKFSTRYNEFYFNTLVQELENSPDKSGDMIKFVRQMEDENNLGISLTRKGCDYVNNLYRRTWWKFNDIFNPVQKPEGVDEDDVYIDPWCAAYGTKAFEVDTQSTEPQDENNPRLVFKTQKDLNGVDLDEEISWLAPFGSLVAMCERPRTLYDSANSRTSVRPYDEHGVRFDIDTGTCTFTESLCDRYIQDYKEGSVPDAATGNNYNTCSKRAGSAELSWVLGDQYADRWLESSEDFNNKVSDFTEDPSVKGAAEAFWASTTVLPEFVGGILSDQWDQNRATSQNDTEAVYKSVIDPTGAFTHFREASAAQLAGKEKWCEQGDACKRFHVKHSGGNVQNWSVRVAEETGGEGFIYNAGRAFQNQVKDSEDHVFYIPGPQIDEETKEITKEAGYFMATATGDIEGEAADWVPFAGGSKCPRKIVFTYSEIDEDKPLEISSWSGCMDERGKQGWQDFLYEGFSEGYEFASDTAACSEDLINTLALPFLHNAIFEPLAEELNDVFGEDGVFANGAEGFKDVVYDGFLEGRVDAVVDSQFYKEGIGGANKIGDVLEGKHDEDIKKFFEDDLINVPEKIGEYIIDFEKQKQDAEEAFYTARDVADEAIDFAREFAGISENDFRSVTKTFKIGGNPFNGLF